MQFSTVVATFAAFAAVQAANESNGSNGSSSSSDGAAAQVVGAGLFGAAAAAGVALLLVLLEPHHLDVAELADLQALFGVFGEVYCRARPLLEALNNFVAYHIFRQVDVVFDVLAEKPDFGFCLGSARQLAVFVVVEDFCIFADHPALVDAEDDFPRSVGLDAVFFGVRQRHTVAQAAERSAEVVDGDRRRLEVRREAVEIEVERRLELVARQRQHASDALAGAVHLVAGAGVDVEDPGDETVAVDFSTVHGARYVEVRAAELTVGARRHQPRRAELVLVPVRLVGDLAAHEAVVLASAADAVVRQHRGRRQALDRDGARGHPDEEPENQPDAHLVVGLAADERVAEVVAAVQREALFGVPRAGNDPGVRAGHEQEPIVLQAQQGAVDERHRGPVRVQVHHVELAGGAGHVPGGVAQVGRDLGVHLVELDVAPDDVHGVRKKVVRHHGADVGYLVRVAERTEPRGAQGLENVDVVVLLVARRASFPAFFKLAPRRDGHHAEVAVEAADRVVEHLVLLRKEDLGHALLDDIVVFELDHFSYRSEHVAQFSDGLLERQRRLQRILVRVDGARTVGRERAPGRGLGGARDASVAREVVGAEVSEGCVGAFCRVGVVGVGVWAWARGRGEAWRPGLKI